MSWGDQLLALLSALGIKIAVLIASTIGGCMSLNFFEGVPQPDGSVKRLACKEKWSIAMSGAAIGVYLSGPALDLMQLTVKSERVEIGLGLILALFGMSLAAQIIRTIRDLKIADVLLRFLPSRTK